MHLGLIGRYGPDAFLDNIGDSLTRMGHSVVCLGSGQVERGGQFISQIGSLALRALPDLENRFHSRLARSALEHECDAVITTDGNLAPRAIEFLRRHRVPVALWFPDAVSNLGRQQMLTAPYTALFFKDPLLVQRLRDMLDLPVWYLPEACNPRWHRPIGTPAAQRVIVVVGNTYLSRLVLLKRLHEAGIPLAIYGGATPRWAQDLLPPSLHTGRAVLRDEKSCVFRTAAGVLNNLHPAEMRGVNTRLFEATGAGAAVLCEERPVLADLFDTEREVVPFSTFSDLVERARELLADSRLAQEIGDGAHKRAHSDHTYEKRLVSILEKLA